MLHTIKISKFNINLSYLSFNMNFLYCFKLPIIAIGSYSIQSDPEQSTPANKILVAIKQISSIASPETATAPLASTSAIPATPPPGHAGGSAEQNKDSVEVRVGDKTTPVFLSYQSAFTGRVLQLKRALEARGIPCWMANEDLVGNVQDAIGEVLMVTPAIIICYSHSYRESMYEYNMLQM